jgi:hypothetical protein
MITYSSKRLEWQSIQDLLTVDIRSRRAKLKRVLAEANEDLANTIDKLKLIGRRAAGAGEAAERAKSLANSLYTASEIVPRALDVPASADDAHARAWTDDQFESDQKYTTHRQRLRLCKYGFIWPRDT